jgi:hypothetical protein
MRGRYMIYMIYLVSWKRHPRMDINDHVDYPKEDADRSDQRYDDWSHWTSCECLDCGEDRLS